MKWILSLLMTCVAGPVWGGGELPFPFEGHNQAVLMANHFWSVDELGLIIETKLFQAKEEPANQWAKIWIRGADGFVWDRVWTRNDHGVLDDEVEIDGTKGRVNLNLNNLGQALLVLDGRVYVLRSIR